MKMEGFFLLFSIFTHKFFDIWYFSPFSKFSIKFRIFWYHICLQLNQKITWVLHCQTSWYNFFVIQIGLTICAVKMSLLSLLRGSRIPDSHFFQSRSQFAHTAALNVDTCVICTHLILITASYFSIADCSSALHSHVPVPLDHHSLNILNCH